MGMFDSVWFDCPSCGHSIEAQSKSGPCSLNSYSPDSVPANVAENIDRHSPFTCKCGKQWRLLRDTPEVQNIKFVVIPA